MLFEFNFPFVPEESYGASRPHYIFDNARIINAEYTSLIDKYLRQLDDTTSAEIIIYTIPSFVGHGIKQNGQEIQDRDTLANFIFNEVPLDGIKGIGKKGKDNGVLILYSKESDSGGGSMRIEVGRGLEGNITDGTAGEILDSYLVPARDNYKSTGNITNLDEAFLNTVIALGQHIGYLSNDLEYKLPETDSANTSNGSLGFGVPLAIIFGILGVMIYGVTRYTRGSGRHGHHGRSGGGYTGTGSWWGGTGGFSGGGGYSGGYSGGGGGGSSGGGGAGR